MSGYLKEPRKLLRGFTLVCLFVWLVIGHEPVAMAHEFRVMQGEASYPLTVQSLDVLLKKEAEERPELYQSVAEPWEKLSRQQSRAELWSAGFGLSSLGMFVGSSLVKRDKRLSWGQGAIGLGGLALLSYWFLAPDSQDLQKFLEMYNDHAKELGQPTWDVEEGWYESRALPEVKTQVLAWNWRF